LTIKEKKEVSNGLLMIAIGTKKLGAIPIPFVEVDFHQVDTPREVPKENISAPA
jgi:hypothetical protein